MAGIFRSTFALTFCVWRYTLCPEGKYPDTPYPEGGCSGTHHLVYICLDILRPEDTHCIQKANSLTLLIWKADAMACIVWKTFVDILCL